MSHVTVTAGFSWARSSIDLAILIQEGRVKTFGNIPLQYASYRIVVSSTRDIRPSNPMLHIAVFVLDPGSNSAPNIVAKGYINCAFYSKTLPSFKVIRSGNVTAKFITRFTRRNVDRSGRIIFPNQGILGAFQYFNSLQIQKHGLTEPAAAEIIPINIKTDRLFKSDIATVSANTSNGKSVR